MGMTLHKCVLVLNMCIQAVLVLLVQELLQGSA
jgi:hypothetical protein